VVEILSRSNTRQDRAAKIEDYRQVGVHECWLVSPEAATVEVLTLSEAGQQTRAIYGLQDTVASVAFPALCIPVAALFEV
jgi:Uma2 family endonuclease